MRAKERDFWHTLAMSGQREQEASEGSAEVRQTDPAEPQERPPELGGPKGPEPTRYGDWERAGRCIDF
jgi:hypothetical protein